MKISISLSGLGSLSSSGERDHFLNETGAQKTETNEERYERAIKLVTLNIPTSRLTGTVGGTPDLAKQLLTEPYYQAMNHWALKIGNHLWELRADGNGSYHARSKPWPCSKNKFISSQEIIGRSCCTDAEIDEASNETISEMQREANYHELYHNCQHYVQRLAKKISLGLTTELENKLTAPTVVLSDAPAVMKFIMGVLCEIFGDEPPSEKEIQNAIAEKIEMDMLKWEVKSLWDRRREILTSAFNSSF
jgi:hypothetical protein